MTATATEAPPSREEQRLRRIIDLERAAATQWIALARYEVRRSRDTAKGLGYEQVRASKERLKTYQQEFTAALDRIDAALQRAEADTNTRALMDCPVEPEGVAALVTAGVEAAWRAMWAPAEPTSPAPTEEENPLLWCQVRAIVAAVQP